MYCSRKEYVKIFEVKDFALQNSDNCRSNRFNAYDCERLKFTVTIFKRVAMISLDFAQK